MLTQEQAEKILTEGCRSVRRIDEEWITNTVVMLRMPWVGTLPKMQVEAKDLDRLLHAPTEPCVERVDLRQDRETKLVACGCADGRCVCECGQEHECGTCHGTKLREKVVTFGRLVYEYGSHQCAVDPRFAPVLALGPVRARSVKDGAGLVVGDPPVAVVMSMRW